MAAEFLNKDRANTIAEATAAAMSGEDYGPDDADDPDTAGEEWKNPA